MSDSPPSRPQLAVVLSVAIVAISSSAVLVRGMSAEPVAIAAWRCFLAAMILAPFVGIPRMTRPDGFRVLAAGMLLGGHFVLWFTSLQHTSVLRSTVLVTLVPAWTGLLEWVWLRRPPAPRFWLGVVLAVIGIGVMSSGAAGAGTLLGDGLAVAAGMLAAVYLLLGQEVRNRVDVLPYMASVSAIAAGFLLPIAWLVSAPLSGYPGWTWILLLAAALGPQLLGHQGLNWAVRWVPASTVAALTLLEPLGSAVLAILFLGEWPGVESVVGSLVIVLGVATALRA